VTKRNVAHYGPLSTSQQPPRVTGTSSTIRYRWRLYLSHWTHIQWELGSALYVIGAGDYAEGDAYLYWYDSTWHDYDIDEDTEFVLGSAPHRLRSELGLRRIQSGGGYIYCLPGNGSEFWRYGLNLAKRTTSRSRIFPPSTSTIADQTPLFQWTGMSNLYRLQVSTEPSFSMPFSDR